MYIVQVHVVLMEDHSVCALDHESEVISLCDPGEGEGEESRCIEMYLHQKFYDCTHVLMV